eukprot:scaffold8312_cov20-Tisochrysis_lutea.AAC.1
MHESWHQDRLSTCPPGGDNLDSSRPNSQKQCPGSVHSSPQAAHSQFVSLNPCLLHTCLSLFICARILADERWPSGAFCMQAEGPAATCEQSIRGEEEKEGNGMKKGRWASGNERAVFIREKEKKMERRKRDGPAAMRERAQGSSMQWTWLQCSDLVNRHTVSFDQKP